MAMALLVKSSSAVNAQTPAHSATPAAADEKEGPIQEAAAMPAIHQAHIAVMSATAAQPTVDGKSMVATLDRASVGEVFDIASGRSPGQLSTSNNIADGVTINGLSKYAFVSSECRIAASGNVDVIDLLALAKGGTVDVGQRARGVAFLEISGSHAVIVSASDSGQFVTTATQ